MVARYGFGAFDPTGEFGRLRDEFNRAFSGLLPGFPTEELAVNLSSNPEEVSITTEVPGLTPDQVQVTLHDDTLTLQCKRPAEPKAEGWTYLKRERESGVFHRTVQLPFRINPESVVAKLDKGVLRITLQRADEDKPRQIKIQAS